MNKKEIKELMNIEWFNPNNQKDKIHILTQLQHLGEYGVALEVLKEIWSDFSNDDYEQRVQG